MFHRRQLAAILLFVIFCFAEITNAQQIEIYFSPKGGAAAAVAKRIDAAKTSVHIMAYAISQGDITTSIINAKERGVEVMMICDPHDQAGNGSTAGKIHKAGVPTLADRAHALMHNKYGIIDGQIVITGSMNWTTAGDVQNAENCLIITDAATAKAFEADFQIHKSHAGVFKRSPLEARKSRAKAPATSLPPNPPAKQEP